MPELSVHGLGSAPETVAFHRCRITTQRTARNNGVLVKFEFSDQQVTVRFDAPDFLLFAASITQRAAAVYKAARRTLR